MATRYDWTFGGKQCLLPDDLLAALGEGHMIPRAFVERANSYVCPLGMTPGRGWVLMKRSDVLALPYNGSSSSTLKVGTTTILHDAYIIKATCMASGRPSGGTTPDPNSIYLVEFADIRYLLTMTGIINAAFNIRVVNPRCATKDASDIDEFNYYSLNSGAVWTWATLTQKLYDWTSASGYGAGSTLTLPETPTGTPESFRFIGDTAWKALHIVLYTAGMTTQFDPVATTITPVKMGAALSTSENNTALFASPSVRSRLLYDADPIESICMRPIQAAVGLACKPDKWGRERDFWRTDQSGTPTDGGDEDVQGTSQLADGLVGSESDPTASGAGVGSVRCRNGVRVTRENTSSGTVEALAAWTAALTDSSGFFGYQFVFDPLTAFTDGSGLGLNSTQVQARVASRCNSHALERYRSDPFMRRLYSGYVAFKPNSECKAVCWRDYGATSTSGHGGFVTEVINGPKYLADPIMGPPSLAIDYGYRAPELFAPAEQLQPPDLTRAKFATEYPREIQWVKIKSTTSPAGDLPASYTEVNASGYFEGGICDPADVTLGTDEQGLCWIFDAQGALVNGEAVAKIGGIYLGKAHGYATVSGDTRPLFAISLERFYGDNFTSCVTVVTGLTGVVPAGLTTSTTTIPGGAVCP